MSDFRARDRGCQARLPCCTSWGLKGKGKKEGGSRAACIREGTSESVGEDDGQMHNRQVVYMDVFLPSFLI